MSASSLAKSNSFSRDTGQWLQLSLLNKTLRLTDQVYNSIYRLGCAFLECNFPPWLVEWGGDGEKRKERTLALTFTRIQVRMIHYWNYFYKEHICVHRSHCHKSISGWLLILFFFIMSRYFFKKRHCVAFFWILGNGYYVNQRFVFLTKCLKESTWKGEQLFGFMVLGAQSMVGWLYFF